MTRKRIRYAIPKLLLLLVAMLALALWLLPWKTMAEARLIRLLEAQGFEQVALRIGSIGLNGITLSDISIGHEPPLKLTNVTVGYSLAELRSGKLRDVTLSGVALTLDKRGDEGWMVAGFAPRPRDAEPPKPFTLPVTREALSILPVPVIAVDDSSLAITSGTLRGTLPLTLTWNTVGPPSVTYRGDAISFTQGEMQFATGNAIIYATLDEETQSWSGSWTIDAITVSGLPVALPPLNGRGTITATAERATLEGTLASADNSHRIQFRLPYRFDAPEATTLTITSARLPWNGGVLSTSGATVPLGAEKPIHLVLRLEAIALDQLMASLTGDAAKGTGTVSGRIPLSVLPDGTVRFGNASLNADAPGTLAVSPEIIPGDNPQVGLVRDILKNLHYSLLSMRVENRPDNRLAVFLTVEGMNPEVAGLRPVRLNVQLNGDLLQLVTHSIMTLTNPETLLKQELQ